MDSTPSSPRSNTCSRSSLGFRARSFHDHNDCIARQWFCTSTDGAPGALCTSSVAPTPQSRASETHQPRFDNTLVFQVHSRGSRDSPPARHTMRQQPTSPLGRLASCLFAVLLLLACSVDSGAARTTRTLQSMPGTGCSEGTKCNSSSSPKCCKGAFQLIPAAIAGYIVQSPPRPAQVRYTSQSIALPKVVYVLSRLSSRSCLYP